MIPNPEIVGLNVKNSLVKSKFHEINELFNKEIFDNVITDADLNYIIRSFSITELNSSNINEIILSILDNFNG